MDWLDELLLPEGQKAVLLKRYPHERARAILVAVARESATRNGMSLTFGDPSALDAIVRASLWDGTKLKDYLTGEWLGPEDYGRADPRVIEKIEIRAATNYIEWQRDALPGPKEPSGTDGSTLPTENPEASETSEKS